MTDTHKGLRVEVYRPAAGHDCTNGGQSAKVDRFTVIGTIRRTNGESVVPLPRDAQVFEPTDSAPAAILVHGAFPGCPPKLVPGETLERKVADKLVGPMAGGNLADTSDSRWREIVAAMMRDDGVGSDVVLTVSTVDIHDRLETQEHYDRMSV